MGHNATEREHHRDIMALNIVIANWTKVLNELVTFLDIVRYTKFQRKRQNYHLLLIVIRIVYINLLRQIITNY